MIPWVHLDTATVPGGGGELKLMQRGAEFSIMAGRIELMNSRLSGSEEALATLVLDRLAGRPAIRMLIGGLGMGFTLRAALANLPSDGSIVVSELVPEVVKWSRGALTPVFGDSANDPRADIQVIDVAQAIAAGKGGYDAILLDVDNGPEGVSRPANDRLYTPAGLTAARLALKKGGILAVWSSGPYDSFTKLLRGANFAVDEVRIKAHRGRSGARHVIWLATKA